MNGWMNGWMDGWMSRWVAGFLGFSIMTLHRDFGDISVAF